MAILSAREILKEYDKRSTGLGGSYGFDKGLHVLRSKNKKSSEEDNISNASKTKRIPQFKNTLSLFSFHNTQEECGALNHSPL